MERDDDDVWRIVREIGMETREKTKNLAKKKKCDDSVSINVGGFRTSAAAF